MSKCTADNNVQCNPEEASIMPKENQGSSERVPGTESTQTPNATS